MRIRKAGGALWEPERHKGEGVQLIAVESSSGERETDRETERMYLEKVHRRHMYMPVCVKVNLQACWTFPD